jgi:hypothetical protein
MKMFSPGCHCCPIYIPIYTNREYYQQYNKNTNSVSDPIHFVGAPHDPFEATPIGFDIERKYLIYVNHRDSDKVYFKNIPGSGSTLLFNVGSDAVTDGISFAIWFNTWNKGLIGLGSGAIASVDSSGNYIQGPFTPGGTNGSFAASLGHFTMDSSGNVYATTSSQTSQTDTSWSWYVAENSEINNITTLGHSLSIANTVTTGFAHTYDVKSIFCDGTNTYLSIAPGAGWTGANPPSGIYQVNTSTGVLTFIIEEEDITQYTPTEIIYAFYNDNRDRFEGMLRYIDYVPAVSPLPARTVHMYGWFRFNPDVTFFNKLFFGFDGDQDVLIDIIAPEEPL